MSLPGDGDSSAGPSAGFTCGKLAVTQDPKEVNVLYGGFANVICHWNMTDVERIKVKWTKYHCIQTRENGIVLLTSLWTPENNSSNISTARNISHIIRNDSAEMRLDSVTEQDGGFYICEVIIEIPTLNTGEGNGTVLHVHKNEESSNRLEMLVIICILPAVILAGCFIYFRRKRPKRKILQRKAEQESPELQHLGQDNGEANENSSSTNSVIWAASMVYESFDYFAMKNKDEKPAASSDQHNACSDEHPSCFKEHNLGKPSAGCDDSATSSDKPVACPDNNMDESNISE